MCILTFHKFVKFQEMIYLSRAHWKEKDVILYVTNVSMQLIMRQPLIMRYVAFKLRQV